ncbi:MAG: TauD/TfdA dioxygenase family protein, partial [Rhodospirillales bacterium]
MTATVTPFKDGFGAEVSDVDLSRPITEETRRVIYQAFLDHHIVAVRGQDLTPAQVVAASRILGDELEPHLFEHFHHP